MNVNTQIILIDFWVINTLIRVTITLTRFITLFHQYIYFILDLSYLLAKITFAFELLSFSIWLPFLLYKAITTCLALIAASIMRAATDEFVRSVRIRRLAVLRMTIANAAATNRYITNTVKVLKNNNNYWVLLSLFGTWNLIFLLVEWQWDLV